MATTTTEAPAKVERKPKQEDRLAEYRPKTDKPARELKRFCNVEEVARRYGWDAVNPLLEGAFTADDLALEVVDDFARMKGAAGRRMLERALDEGIESVPDAPDSLKRLFEELDNPPEWVDWEQLRRGSIAYFRSGPLVPFILTCSIIGGSERAYGITRPIVFTGRFEEYAAIRARETARWLVAATRPDGMRRFAEGFKLTVHVRMLHAMTRRSISKSPSWDWDEWGTPIADVDGLYAISYDFTQQLVDPLLEIGVKYSEREIEDIYALWRYIGHVLGVPDHLLHRGPAQARQFADMYLSLDPGADDECRRLLRSLIETATPEEDDGLDVFPGYITKLFPPERLRKLLWGFTRFWMEDDVAESLAVPNTPWKYAGHALKPVARVYEAGRRLGLIKDEQMAEIAIGLLEHASKPREQGEKTIADASEVEQAVQKRATVFRGKRGRAAGAAAYQRKRAA
jgi:hypothetical protein